MIRQTFKKIDSIVRGKSKSPLNGHDRETGAGASFPLRGTDRLRLPANALRNSLFINPQKTPPLRGMEPHEDEVIPVTTDNMFDSELAQQNGFHLRHVAPVLFRRGLTTRQRRCKTKRTSRQRM